VLCAEFRMASGTPKFAQREEAIYLAFNAGDDVELTLPGLPEGFRWVRHVDTSQTMLTAEPVTSPITLAANSVLALVEEPA